MSDDPWPTAIASADLEICGVTLRAHVLDNGQRVFEVAGVHALMTAWAEGVPMGDADSEALARFIAGPGHPSGTIGESQ